METNQIIGRNIKAYRERFGMSQQQLADYLKVDRVSVSYYETGSREIPVHLLEKLSDFFGVELADFLEESAEANTANVAFAFRAEELNNEDMESIARFKKIVKNYLKMQRLSQK